MNFLLASHYYLHQKQEPAKSNKSNLPGRAEIIASLHSQAKGEGFKINVIFKKFCLHAFN